MRRLLLLLLLLPCVAQAQLTAWISTNPPSATFTSGVTGLGTNFMQSLGSTNINVSGPVAATTLSGTLQASNLTGNATALLSGIIPVGNITSDTVTTNGIFFSRSGVSGIASGVTATDTTLTASGLMTALGFVGPNMWNGKVAAGFTHFEGPAGLASLGASSGGTGSGSAGSATIPVQGDYGVYVLVTGTQQSGGGSLYAYTGTKFVTGVVGTNFVRFRMESSLPSAASYCMARFGFSSIGSTSQTNWTAPANGFYAQIVTNGAGTVVLQLVTTLASSSSTTNMAATLYPNTWYHLMLGIDANTNGICTIGSNTTSVIEAASLPKLNMPTAAVGYGIGFVNYTDAVTYTSRNLYLDYYGWLWVYPSSL